jgi:exosortase
VMAVTATRTEESRSEVAMAAAPWIAAAAAFAFLYWRPIADTARLWWTDADAGHGLLLVPAAVFLAWRAGLAPERRGQVWLGGVLLLVAVALRYLSALAAELFTMRLSVLIALFGIVAWVWGAKQLRRWWLPACLLLLAMPLPEVLIGSLSLPLQFKASQMGAALLNWRHVPAGLEGNVILLARPLPNGGFEPVTQLFVTEACSGLRSLSALLALGFLIGGIWLKTGWSRALLVLAAIPIAMALNSVRIFLTGFAVFYIDESLGEGLMHYTEGWAMFLAAFLVLGAATWLLAKGEAPIVARRAAA